MSKLIAFTIFLGQTTAVQPEWFIPLINICVLGPVCYWFMKQEERRMVERKQEEENRNAAIREQAKALTQNTKSNLIIILALKNLDSNISAIAQQLKEEIEKNESHALPTD